MRNPLWGLEGDLDYWSALARGEVPENEQKAVALLARIVDEYRFSLYCVTGQLPLMGNVTGRTFLALKSGGLLELEDGHSVAWWCFSIGPYAPDIPDTDNVVMCRTMVEGEELAFLATGDRHERGHFMSRHRRERLDGVTDPFLARIVQRDMMEAWPDKRIGTDQILDIQDLQRDYWWYEDIEELRRAVAGQLQPRPNKSMIFPVLGVDVPYPQDFQMPHVAPDALQELHDLRERLDAQQIQPDVDIREEELPDGGFIRYDAVALADVGAQVGEDLRQYARRPLVERTPHLLDGSGVDMHDGTLLQIQPEAAQAYYEHTGRFMHEIVQGMLDEGHYPEDIEMAVNQLLDDDVRAFMEMGVAA